ncbi:unnamed protein product, partial [Cuscuta epithymum]
MVVTRRNMEDKLELLERELAEQREEARLRDEEMNRKFELVMQKLDRESRSRSNSSRTSARNRSRSKSTKASARKSSCESSSTAGNLRSTHSKHADNRSRLIEKTGRKVDLPLFNGSDAYGWTIKVERFFKLNHIAEVDKIELVTLAMEGRALNWYQWWEEHSNVRTWELFRQALLERFEPGLEQDPYGPLLNVKQTGSVMDYRDEFELVAGPLKNTDVQFLKGIFMKGLKAEVRAELKLNPVSTLTEIMNKASRVEERNQTLNLTKGKEEERRGSKGNVSSPSQRWLQENKWKGNLTSNQSGMDKSSAEKSNEAVNKNAGVKGTHRLTQSELQELSRKGLCFKCGEQWGKGHICRMKHFQIMMIDDSEEEEEQGDFSLEASPEREISEPSKMQLSLMSKEGLTTPRTFKLKGEIQGCKGKKEVVILIDCGATHNFVSARVVQELGIPVLHIPEFRVEIGNGEQITNNGRCEALSVRVQQAIITQDFYTLDLGGTELVLGMEWLSGLGNVEFNFHQLSIKWIEGNQSMMLKGDPHLSKTVVSLKSLVKAMPQQEEGYCLYQFEGIQGVEEQPSNLGWIQRFKTEFPEVFKPLEGLPPKRDCDHSINIKVGSTIPNIRPY